MWWIIGNHNKTEFVSWSCGQLEGLEKAAVYRSAKNANDKIKQLQKHDPKHYAGLFAYEVEPQFK